MTLKQRLQSPTPQFFKEVSKWGLVLAAIGGTIMASPVALPVLVIKIASYITVAGAVATAVSQAGTTAEDAP